LGLSYTGAELELIDCATKIQWLRKCTRGGFSWVGKRYLEANNPSIPNTYNPTQPKKWICFLDCVNLYGYAMQNWPLPQGDFRWIDDAEKIDLAENILTYDFQSSEIGYFVECDIIFPREIHEKTKYFSLAPDHEVISYNEMSDYQKTVLNAHPNIGRKFGSKLTASLKPR